MAKCGECVQDEADCSCRSNQDTTAVHVVSSNHWGVVTLSDGSRYLRTEEAAAWAFVILGTLAGVLFAVLYLKS